MFRAALAAVALALTTQARADFCVSDMWDNGWVEGQTVFPNWVKVWAGSFDIQMCLQIDCDDGVSPDVEHIVGVTVVNFGSAKGVTDISKVYLRMSCPSGGTTIDTGLYTMSYAGTYKSDSGSYPAWTWTGVSSDLSQCDDNCELVLCGAAFTMDLYADIASCPTNNSTIQLGFPLVETTNTFFFGSINDDYPANNGAYNDDDCFLPWNDEKAALFNIEYVQKEGDDFVAPGDTITYTVTYGRPGTGSASSIVIMDTQPPYTHYVPGSAAPPPDSSWDPNLGPPMKLRWTIAGPISTTGGPTGQVVFSLSVDWGNGESFEPGSGDDGAPEGARLQNSAQVFFNGVGGCPVSMINPPVNTIVRRFLFWKIGDNDVVFAQSIGRPMDEMVYDIFVKNMSDEKTWWDVRVWDTVPNDIDVWCNNCGLDDPCVGWTMTPSGCAYGGAGKILGASTVLTWQMDMPPNATITLRWKGTLKATAQSGGTVINKAAVQELGATGIVGGSGSSKQARYFTHMAAIILPTTYVSYVGFVAAGDDPQGDPGYFITFFPLNKQSQFELRGLHYQGAGWATTGGVSASIGCLVGDCMTGFPGSSGCLPGVAIPTGGWGGCKVERAPAQYDPTIYKCPNTTCMTWPLNFIYKVTSNCPVLWQLLTHISHDAQDNHTYAPSTSMNYSGFMHYCWRRTGMNNNAGGGDGDVMILANTGIDANGKYQADLATTVHLFKFDYTTLSWSYDKTFEIAGESIATDLGPDDAIEYPWRIISSDTKLLAYEGFSTISFAMSGSGAYDNHGAYMPTAETGNTVSPVGYGTFYGPVVNYGNWDKVIITNVGAAAATYHIWKYNPDSPVAVGNLPPSLAGTSGTWQGMGTDVVPAGFAAVGNPRTCDGNGTWCDTVGPGAAMFKIQLDGGGPIEVCFGRAPFGIWSGGAVLNAADGQQVGNLFWMSQTNDIQGKCDNGNPCQAIDVFCPKTGMAVRAISTDGFTATYTTTGPDQCIAFSPVPGSVGLTNNWQFISLTGDKVILQYIDCKITEKGYTAPFLQTGTHYNIIMPPVVYIGQTFWITVVVVEVGGTTKCDYTGTTSFSSTDPTAQIEAKAMDGYNYTWKGVTDCGVKMFFKVTFSKAGMQTIVAMDVVDGSIAGVGATMVVAADIKLTKLKKITVAASGDTVKFQICWSNYSSASGFSFTITDAVPMGTTYVPEIASTMLCQASTPLPSFIVWYSTAVTTTPPATFTSVPGTSSPLNNTRWLRWTIRDVYVNSTGCVCFKVSVN